MTTNNTTQENSRQAGLHLPYFLFASILVTALLVMVALGKYVRSDVDVLEAQRAPLLQVPAIIGAEVYMMVEGWDGQNTVLVIDPDSGEVNRRFGAGYNAAVKLTADRRILYIYEQSEVVAWPDLFVTGVTSAIDTRTGAVLWQVDIPGARFGPSTGTIWLSSDEQRLYMQGNPGIGLNPHIFVVDTRTGVLLHDFELPLPYPSNVDQAFPSVWKLPWDEMLVVASRDQLFTFDLHSGQAGNAIQLFVPGDIQHVPLNLPHTAYVHSGIVDPETRRLLLATSTQEIFSVDLDTQPFTIQRVVSLPGGWQFSVMNPILLNPKEKALYVQVKRGDTPITNGLEVDEVWVYDSTTWAQKASLNLREQLANAPSTSVENSVATGLVLTNYGLALSPDGQTVYSISQRGLLEITQGAKSRLQGTWLHIGGEDPKSFALKFLIP